MIERSEKRWIRQQGCRKLTEAMTSTVIKAYFLRNDASLSFPDWAKDAFGADVEEED